MQTLELANQFNKIKIAKLILGTAEFGTSNTEIDCLKYMDYYFEHGGTTIDTANFYGRWGKEQKPTSEKIIGKWLIERNNRTSIKIITKGLHPDIKSPDIPRVSAKAINDDIRDSLNNLRTDYLDVYMLHRDDKSVGVGDLMEQLHTYVEDGVIKVIGVSNWTVKRILEANQYALKHQLTPFSVSSIRWSLAEVTPEYDEFADLPHMNPVVKEDYCKMGIPVLAWSSQANGIITKVIEEGKASLKEKTKNKFYNETTKSRIAAVREVMKKTGLTPTQIVLGYITNNSLQGAAIVGCSRIEQLISAMTAADVFLSREIVNELE